MSGKTYHWCTTTNFGLFICWRNADKRKAQHQKRQANEMKQTDNEGEKTSLKHQASCTIIDLTSSRDEESKEWLLSQGLTLPVSLCRPLFLLLYELLSILMTTSYLFFSLNAIVLIIFFMTEPSNQQMAHQHKHPRRRHISLHSKNYWACGSSRSKISFVPKDCT